MIRRAFPSCLAALLCAAAILPSACARSRPTNYYVLSPATEGSAGKSSAGGDAPTARVTLAPVEIPGYLDRAQIVTRTGPDSLNLAEYDRWAEPLSENVRRVLADNLSVLMPFVRIDKEASTSPPESLDLRVRVTLKQFEGVPGGKAVLAAQWEAVPRQGGMKAIGGTTRIEEPLGGANHASLAAALSRLLGSLSREMAAALNETAPKGR